VIIDSKTKIVIRYQIMELINQIALQETKDTEKTENDVLNQNNQNSECLHPYSSHFIREKYSINVVLYLLE
jgi:hypothetical protein